MLRTRKVGTTIFCIGHDIVVVSGTEAQKPTANHVAHTSPLVRAAYDFTPNKYTWEM